MRILFVHNALRSFVQTDRDILAFAHEIDELDVSIPCDIASLPVRLTQADMVFAWFASAHSAVPVVSAALLRKPSIVVVGGYDTARMPEIGYGSMAHPVKRQVVREICRVATALLVNSEAARQDVIRNVGVRTPIHVIHHGFVTSDVIQPFAHLLDYGRRQADTTESVPTSAGGPRVSAEALPTGERQQIVLSIGAVNRSNLLRKGHEAFVRSAAHIPEAQFILAGRHEDDAAAYLRSIATSNVELPGFVPGSEFTTLIHRASVYVQVSAHEGFGCALGEAMAAGCVPVISRRGALPEVAGPSAIYVSYGDPEAIAAGVREALTAPASARAAAKQRIANEFPLSRRQNALLHLVQTIAGTGRYMRERSSGSETLP